MALEIKLHQKLSQSLVMTPQLQQAIKLLQLSRGEYLEVLERELLENPILEDARDHENSAPNAGQQERPEEPQQERATTKQELETRGGGEEFNVASYLDLYADSYSPNSGGVRRNDSDNERASVESLVSQPEGLSQHLFWQLRTSDLQPSDRDVALQIIGNLDRNGYLALTIEEVCEMAGATPEAVSRVLSVVQTFDPPGIAALDLRDCLLIQLEQHGLGGSLAARLVRDHLPRLESHRYDLLGKELGLSVTEIRDALKIIRAMEPRPGRPFVDEAPVYITPDIYVRKIGDDYTISLNESGMPKLRLNPRYRDMMRDGKGKDESQPQQDYIQERVRSAAWLIRSIHQRQQTIFRVAESIVKFQREFLEHGVTALRPLVLRDVAEDVGMHESTVSRVTSNKYMHTPQGVYELKYFFSSGLRSEQGEVSSESVKERIKELVGAEDQRKPLSDHAIAEQLKSEGIDIARRTVAKYREMLNILSSSRRKQVF